MTKTCETCRFWVRAELGRDHGDCHRYPPQDDDSAILSAYWCGEHQPRQPAEAEAPQPGAVNAGQAADEAKTMRLYADQTPKNWKVPIDPATLRRWADLIDALSAAPAAPARAAMAPETRRVLEDAAAAMSVIALDDATCARLERICNKHVTAIRAHLVAHGGDHD